jgi:hypothetical protein
LTANYPNRDFYRDIIPEMKKIALIALKASYGGIDPNKKENSFEVFIH